MFPIRCFTCNKVIGNKWEKYKDGLVHKKTDIQILNELGITRYCCKRMFLCHVEIIEKLLNYPNNIL